MFFATSMGNTEYPRLAETCDNNWITLNETLGASSSSLILWNWRMLEICGMSVLFILERERKENIPSFCFCSQIVGKWKTGYIFLFFLRGRSGVNWPESNASHFLLNFIVFWKCFEIAVITKSTKKFDWCKSLQAFSQNMFRNHQRLKLEILVGKLCSLDKLTNTVFTFSTMVWVRSSAIKDETNPTWSWNMGEWSNVRPLFVGPALELRPSSSQTTSWPAYCPLVGKCSAIGFEPNPASYH